MSVRTVAELADGLMLRQLTDLDVSVRAVRDVCVCDLLSWVLAHGEAGAVWVTVRTHLTVVAIACLRSFACVVVPDGIEVPRPTVERADREGVPVFSSARTGYALCCGMCALGIGCP